MTIDNARREIIKSIGTLYGQNEANNIAELLIESITKLPRSDRIIRGNETLSIAQKNLLDSSISRLQTYEPIQYIINEAWFAGMRFYVDKSVLIPRPETEELVEWVVGECGRGMEYKILDVGTGSGCIAIAVKNKLPAVEVWACDISDEAVNIARINADALHATIDFVPLDFLDRRQRKQLPNVDVVVSNPPYVPQNEKKQIKKNVVEYEPAKALFVPDDDPLVFYKEIAAFGREKLNKGGRIYAEIHENFGEQIRDLFLLEGYKAVELKKDLQERDRMVKVIN